MNVALDIRATILEAAAARFRHFGFGKTTMAEIARDCGMSAGNLYRYFENKQEIGCHIALGCMAQREEAARQVVAHPGLNAADRLVALIVQFGASIHGDVTDDTLINELVQHITEKRWELVEAHLATLHGLVAEVLDAGHRAGEFEVAEVAETAWAVLSACKGFLYPPLVAMCSEEQLDREARQVARLLIRGLARRDADDFA